MKVMLVATLFTLVLIQVTKARLCTSPRDCRPDECCCVSMVRYARPECRRLGKPGDRCIVGNTAQDRDLHFPFGVLYTKQVYRLFCPCSTGLTCKRAVCQL